MSKFKANNQDAKSKKYGPKVVRIPNRNGYYIRWYENRSDIRDLIVTLKGPIGLNLKKAKNGGLILCEDPQKGALFYGVAEKGAVILKVAGRKINSVNELTAVINEFNDKKVSIRVNINGKTGTIPRLIKAGKTREEAQRKLKNLPDLLSERKKHVEESYISFSQVVDDYLVWINTPAAGYSKRWKNDVAKIIEKHRARWGARPVDQITHQDVLRWFNRRSAEVAPSTIVNELSTLRKAFRLAIEYNYIKEDPTAGISVRQSPKRVPKHLSSEEISILLRISRAKDDSRLNPDVKDKKGRTKTTLGQTPDMLLKNRYNADGTFDTARINFFLLTALRKSQLVDLKWSDYDPDRGVITLQTTEEHSEKSRRVNVIPLPDKAKEIIEGQPRTSEYIFPNLLGKKDKQIHLRLGRIFKQFERETGKHLHIHMFRHTALTMFLNHTGNLAATSRLAGHSDTKVTEIYAHVLDDQMRNLTADFDCTA